VPDPAGKELRIKHGIGGGSPLDYALTHALFDSHARIYGPMGGLAQLANLIQAIRKRRKNTLLVMAGDNLGGPLSHLGQGEAEAKLLEMLAPDLRFPVASTEPRASEGGLQFVPIPPGLLRSSLPDLADRVAALRANGPVIAVSAAGLDADRVIAAEVEGISLILSRGAPLPDPEEIGQTRIVTCGAQGRFLLRCDLRIENGEVAELAHRLIPVFADLVPPHPKVRTAQRAVRAPARHILLRPLARTEVTLGTADVIGSGWDNLITQALLEETGAEVAVLAPKAGGHSLPPGAEITMEDVLSVTGGMSYAVNTMQGATLISLLQAAADQSFAEDGLMRGTQGMLAVGGIAMQLNPAAKNGEKLSAFKHIHSERKLLPEEDLRVALAGVQQIGEDDLASLLQRYLLRIGSVSEAAPAIWLEE
jgi:sulfur-oxidizing protein SoxB